MVLDSFDSPNTKNLLQEIVDEDQIFSKVLRIQSFLKVKRFEH